MYFSVSQYPELKGLASQEQNALLKAALRAHDPRQTWRFFGALAAVLSFGVAAGVIEDLAGYDGDLLQWASFALCGLGFYGYLLWEINGATRGALLKHLEEQRRAQRTTST